jgi:hypothetical protein
MSYVLEELRGLDTILSDLKKRIEALERDVSEIKAQIKYNLTPRRATENQKRFINDICKTLNIPYPPGYPSRITFEEASKFIDEKAKFFYDAKRKEGVKATA